MEDPRLVIDSALVETLLRNSSPDLARKNSDQKVWSAAQEATLAVLNAITRMAAKQGHPHKTTLEQL